MSDSLKNIKEEKEVLRSALVHIYREKEVSVRAISMQSSVAYATVHTFMNGGNISIKNMKKLQSWVATQNQ